MSAFSDFLGSIYRAGKKTPAQDGGRASISFPATRTKEALTLLWQYLVTNKNAPHALAIEQECVDFIAYCAANFSASRAQLFQDLYVAFKLGEKRDGFFVEFGATDGIALSNTYWLETTLGWGGILAEPLPVWKDSLARNRKAAIDYRCVWSRSGEQIEFLATQYPELASIKDFSANDFHRETRAQGAQTIVVETVSLNDLLSQHQAPAAIDYLSVDTEGSELEILRAFDFDRFRPRVITVEHNYNAEQREAIRRLLEAKGYAREFEIFSLWDDWYCRPPAVSGPPGGT